MMSIGQEIMYLITAIAPELSNAGSAASPMEFCTCVTSFASFLEGASEHSS